MSFWPYGIMAEELADAVLKADPTAIDLAKNIKLEADKAREQDKILHEAYNAIDDCRFDIAKELIERARAVGCVDEPEITRAETWWHCEKDTTVLDRVAQCDQEEVSH